MSQPPDPTLNELFDLLKRGLWLALLVGAALAAAAYFASRSLPTVYEAQTPLFAGQEARGLPGLAAPAAPLLDVPTYEAAVSSLPVQQDVATTLGSPNALDAMSVSLEGELAQNSSLLYVTVRGPDPERVAATADATAQALVRWDERRTERLIEQTIARLESQLTALSRRLAELSLAEGEDPTQRNELLGLQTQLTTDLNLTRTLQGNATSSLEVLEPAPLPDVPVAPNPLRNAAIAFVLGLFLGYGVALLRDALDTRVRSGAELEARTGLPLLAALPRARKNVGGAVESLYVQLGFVTDPAPRTIVLTSVQGDARLKAQVALALAKSFQQENKRVLLLDAADHVAASDAPTGGTVSLQYYLRHPDAPLEPQQVKVQGVTLERLRQDPDTPIPADLLRRELAPLLHRLQQSYDLIVIDAPPLLTHTYSLVFVAAGQATLLFVDAKRDRYKEVSSAVTLLQRSPAPFTGLVAQNLDDASVTRAFAGGAGRVQLEQEGAVTTSNAVGTPR